MRKPYRNRRRDVCLHLELTLAEPLSRHAKCSPPLQTIIIKEGANTFVAANISAIASRAEASTVCSKEKARRKTARRHALALTRREVQPEDL